MLGRGRRHVAGPISRGRYDRATKGAKEVARHRMGGDPHGDRRKACSRKLSNWALGLPRHHKGQWTGPKYLCEPGRGWIELAEQAGCSSVMDMRDQRIEGRPAFGLVEASDSPGVRGVSA